MKILICPLSYHPLPFSPVVCSLSQNSWCHLTLLFYIFVIIISTHVITLLAILNRPIITAFSQTTIISCLYYGIIPLSHLVSALAFSFLLFSTQWPRSSFKNTHLTMSYLRLPMFSSLMKSLHRTTRPSGFCHCYLSDVISSHPCAGLLHSGHSGLSTVPQTWQSRFCPQILCSALPTSH